MSQAREALLDRLMDRYNAQDVDAYAAMFTEEGCEGGYRGDVVRQGRAGIRDGYAKVFAEFPQNRATVLEKFVYADQIVVREHVSRSPESEPFEVMAIYSFKGDLIDRVEFIR
ncbi:MAG TPA: nuclear transport factor 2 family protein [Sphingomonas sp.]|nr:nuclear transport factor 2 family protein [Sphingomonas sp.]